MVLIVYVLIILSTVTQSASSKCFKRYSIHSTIFNTVRSSTALLLFALSAVFGFQFHLPTVLCGCIYGISLSLSMYAGHKALCLGPMALTSMLASFSVILPLIYGIIFGNEPLNLFKYIAIACLFFAIVMINADKLKAKKSSTEEKTTNYRRWLLFVAMAFVCNGICSILQKIHQTEFPDAYSKEFMLFAMLVCTTVFLTASFFTSHEEKKQSLRGAHYAVLAGVANAVANFLTLVMAGFENATVLFPILSAGAILGAVLCGRFLFREKLKANHYVALVAGITAIVLLKI